MPERGTHWAGGGIPEAYRHGSSDYPKSRKTKLEGGFVPIEEVPDTSSLNPEEHLLMKEEEGLLDGSLEQQRVWNELMEAEIDDEEDLKDSVDKTVHESDLIDARMKIEAMNEVLKTKHLKGESIAGKNRGQGERPARKPKNKKPIRRQNAA